MSGIRKWLCLFLGVALAAFAVSANAGGTGSNKAITLSDTPAGSVLGATLTATTYNISFVLTNSGQSGNASSAELDVVGPQITINSGTISVVGKGATAGSVITPGQTPGSSQGITFNYTLPNKTSATITLNVTVTAGSTCGAPQITWQPYAWTGGVGAPSTSFTAPPQGTYTSNVPGAGPSSCKLSFADKNGNPTQPADAFVGSVITTVPFNSTAASVQVLATQNGQPVTTGVSVLIGDVGACSVSASVKTGSDGTVSLTGISSSAPSDSAHCMLTAAATGFSGATSNAFDVDTPDGTLSCAAGAPHKGNLDPNSVPGIAAGADFGLKRGLNADANKTCGADVPYTFKLNGDNTVTFTEDSLGQATSVTYVVRWAPVDLDAPDKWSTFRPCVQYGPAANDPPLFQVDPATGVCVGDYVPVLACVKNDVSGGTFVMPTIPDDYPYNTAFESGYSQYQPNTLAQVCVAQQGWTSNNLVKNGQVQYWHLFIDQSDMRITGP